jgi:hypothetical protein
MKREHKYIVIDTGKVGGGRENYRIENKRYRGKAKSALRRDSENYLPPISKEHPKKSWATDTFPGDRLTPIVRALEKSVGKNWNKVWSKICEDTDEREIKGYHLREHIMDYVLEQGKSMPGSRWYERLTPFYVDDYGILRKNKDAYLFRRNFPRRAPQEEELTVFRGKCGYTLEKRNGIWYKLMSPGKDISWRTKWGSYVQRYLPPQFRQLSKKELKEEGISNDPQ